MNMSIPRPAKFPTADSYSRCSRQPRSINRRTAFLVTRPFEPRRRPADTRALAAADQLRRGLPQLYRALFRFLRQVEGKRKTRSRPWCSMRRLSICWRHGGKSRCLPPIPTGCLPRLQDWAGKPLSYPGAWKAYTEAAIDAGLTHFGTHTLRHSYRAWLGDVGAPIDVQAAAHAPC